MKLKPGSRKTRLKEEKRNKDGKYKDKEVDKHNSRKKKPTESKTQTRE